MKIILIGSSGAMGRTISRIVAEEGNNEIIAGLQSTSETLYEYPVFTEEQALQNYVQSLSDKADIIIDFSSPALTFTVTNLALSLNLPVLIATTGQTSSDLKRIQEVSQQIPILLTHNTSIGVAAFMQTLKQMTQFLYPQGYDIEIIEHHHRYKQDSPSGTALMLKDAIEQVIQEEVQVIYGRQGKSDGRPHHEIAIHAIRAGDIVGEHQVIFAGQQEEIILTHKAQSKDLFAKGALKTTSFLLGKKPGLYSLRDLI